MCLRFDIRTSLGRVMDVSLTSSPTERNEEAKDRGRLRLLFVNYAECYIYCKARKQGLDHVRSFENAGAKH